MHVNTVTQRLDRVGRLLGKDWSTPGRALEMQLALRLHRLTDRRPRLSPSYPGRRASGPDLRAAVRCRVDRAHDRARAPRRPLDRAPPGASPPRRVAPGPRLPLHLLLRDARPAAPLASRAGRRPGAHAATGRRRTPAWRWYAHRCRRRRAARRAGVPGRARRHRRASSGGCSRRRRPGRRSAAASGCTSGRWSTATSGTRHAVPLRLGQAGTDAVVEAHPIRCTHFDAFRFFTPPAVGRNRLQPTRETQPELEQPGCLHATMDLYKWAYKLEPGHPRRAPGRLLRARRRGARAGHARLALRPAGPRLRAGRDRDARRQGGVRRRAARVRRARRRPARAG